MNTHKISELLRQRPIFLDGATGTELQKQGLPKGICPELWVLDNPQIIQDIQSRYASAGSDIVYSCTFGANRLKLDAHDASDIDVTDLNARLVKISREAVGDSKMVAGDIGPTGQFVEPFGDLPFEEAVNVFKEQIKGISDAGADIIVIETMMDIQEARAALIAAREICDLPVMVSMTYGEDGHTLTGTSPETAVVILQSLGAFAVGCNCSTGPESMAGIITAMRSHARVPLFAKPNAGLPTISNGQTVFNMDAETFAQKAGVLVEAGASIIGGCCGTTPEHIAALKNYTKNSETSSPNSSKDLHLASPRRLVTVSQNAPITLIGERINPTGKKRLRAALREGNFAEPRRLALEQADAGADILDVNVGMPGIDEKSVMRELVLNLSVACELPLVVDSSSPEVVESALRVYPGRALVNSISGERIKLEKLLPVAAKYGAAILLLPLDDNGIPETSQGRATVVQDIMKHASKYGYEKCDVIVDGLVMTISNDTSAAKTTIDTVRWASHEFGVNTTMGLSNVSFGLPERPWLNAALLAMSMANGLSAVIADPADEIITKMRHAADAVHGRDDRCMRYIEHFVSTDTDTPTTTQPSLTMDPPKAAHEAVIRGRREEIESIVQKALDEGIAPYDLVQNHLIPAIMAVGEKFEKKEYFLPQLMLSAETMERAFKILEPLIEASGAPKAGKVIMATVLGDIHDIGKNIVSLMLRNHGFEVLDLGKDVSAETVIEAIRSSNASLVGLSALMTTTMGEMKRTIEMSRHAGLKVKFMVGGAVVTQRYADEIGADGYARDAVGAARLARDLIKPS